MQLELLWWVIDIDYCYWSVDLQVYFEEEFLSVECKVEFEFLEDVLVCKVMSVNLCVVIVELYVFQVGDEIVVVGGEICYGGFGFCGFYIKINVKLGDMVMFDVLCVGEKILMLFKIYCQYYRKNK